jgi:hypothetical protein
LASRGTSTITRDSPSRVPQSAIASVNAAPDGVFGGLADGSFIAVFYPVPGPMTCFSASGSLSRLAVARPDTSDAKPVIGLLGHTIGDIVPLHLSKKAVTKQVSGSQCALGPLFKGIGKSRDGGDHGVEG